MRFCSLPITYFMQIHLILVRNTGQTVHWSTERFFQSQKLYGCLDHNTWCKIVLCSSVCLLSEIKGDIHVKENLKKNSKCIHKHWSNLLWQ